MKTLLLPLAVGFTLVQAGNAHAELYLPGYHCFTTGDVVAAGLTPQGVDVVDEGLQTYGGYMLCGTGWHFSGMQPRTFVEVSWEQDLNHYPTTSPLYNFRSGSTVTQTMQGASEQVDGQSATTVYLNYVMQSAYAGVYYQYQSYDANYNVRAWSEVGYNRTTPEPSPYYGVREIAWDTDANAVSYDVTVHRSGWGGRTFTARQGTSMNLIGIGTYEYFVMANYADNSQHLVGVPMYGTSGPLSNTGSIALGEAAPERPRQTVDWSPIPGAVEYTLRMSRDTKDFVDDSLQLVAYSVPFYDVNGNQVGQYDWTREEPSALLLWQTGLSSTGRELDEQLEYGHTYHVRVEAKNNQGVVIAARECSFVTEEKPRQTGELQAALAPSRDNAVNSGTVLCNNNAPIPTGTPSSDPQTRAQPMRR